MKKQTAITISINKSIEDGEQRMTSLEIAELTGKQHKNLMRDIRNMESAWEKVNGLKFELVNYKDSKGEIRPCYSLNKTECLYIATGVDRKGTTVCAGHDKIKIRNKK